MDRDLFIKLIDSFDANTEFNEERLITSLRRCIDANMSDGYPRGHENLIIVGEELDELGQEVSKELRGKGNYYGLLEETADVIIGIYQLMELCGLSKEDIAAAINIKIDRLNNEIDKNGEYR